MINLIYGKEFNMFNILSVIFKYLFIIVIYFFIYSIIKLIYMDIRGLSFVTTGDTAYIHLLSDIDSIPYLIKEYYLLNRELSLGRGINNDIIIPDAYVSKQHFRIKNIDEKYYLIDLNSANGTFLNGKKVLREGELKDGDIIRVHNIEFKFRKNR